MLKRGIVLVTCLFYCCIIVIAQPPKGVHWTKDGSGYYETDQSGITLHTLPSDTKKTVVDKSKLTPAGTSTALNVRNFFFSDDGKKVLIYTNSKRVWRYDTKGDYWVLDLSNNKLTQI